MHVTTAYLPITASIPRPPATVRVLVSRAAAGVLYYPARSYLYRLCGDWDSYVGGLWSHGVLEMAHRYNPALYLDIPFPYNDQKSATRGATPHRSASFGNGWYVRRTPPKRRLPGPW